MGEGEGGRLTGGIHIEVTGGDAAGEAIHLTGIPCPSPHSSSSSSPFFSAWACDCPGDHDGAGLPRDGDEVEASNDSSPCSSGGSTFHSDSGHSSALEDDCATESASLASDPSDSGDLLFDQALDHARALAKMGFPDYEDVLYEESRSDPLIGANLWLDDPRVRVSLVGLVFRDRVTGDRIYGWRCMDGHHCGLITRSEVYKRNPRLQPVVVTARLVSHEGKLCVLWKLLPGKPTQDIEIENRSTDAAHLEVLNKIGEPLSRDPGGVVLSSCLRQVPPPCQASMLGGDRSRGHQRHLGSLLGHRGRPLVGLLYAVLKPPGSFRRPLGASWGPLRAEVSICWCVFPLLGLSWGRLGAILGSLGRLLARLQALWGCLGTPLGVCRGVLGSWAPMEPSWSVGNSKRR